MAKELDEKFREELAKNMLEKFGIEVNTRFNFFAMELVTVRVDGVDFTQEQKSYAEGFESGYLSAMTLVQQAT